MTRLRFHPEARYYTRRDPKLADRFTDALRDVTARIRDAPLQVPEYGLLAVPTAHGPLFYKLRRCLLPKPFPFAVFYCVRERTAIVLAIAHAERRPGYWAGRF